MMQVLKLLPGISCILLTAAVENTKIVDSSGSSFGLVRLPQQYFKKSIAAASPNGSLTMRLPSRVLSVLVHSALH